MVYLGLDLGSKTLGMAISDLTGMIASNLGTLYFEDENYSELLEKIKVSSLKSLIFLSLLYTEIEEIRLLEFSKYSKLFEKLLKVSS